MFKGDISWVAPFIAGIGYFGLIVFAISGALAAGRFKMDPIGFMVLGTATAIGGGTVRDLLLDQPVSWIQSPGVLGLTVGVSLLTYFFIPGSTARWKAMTWFDALGLAAFSVTGAQASLMVSSDWTIAIAMGMLSATGGGVIRDLLSNQQPFILRGELYASTALGGAATFVGLDALGVATPVSMISGFAVTFVMRASAILFGLQLGAPGEWWQTNKSIAVQEAAEQAADAAKQAADAAELATEAADQAAKVADQAAQAADRAADTAESPESK
jgi:uncharacterized membrane protein YeiH